jgi:prepilin-type N-terminal cleavage/methylation domain-containing protein
MTMSNVKQHTRSRNAGFTLIEIIIVIVIVGVISTIAALIILEGAKAFSIEDRRSNVHYQARLAVERMAREIRLIRSRTGTDIPVMAANDLSYTDVSGNQMRYQLVGNAIQHSQNATVQPLATNVTALAFTYFQQDGTVALTAATLWYVVIDITAQQGAETLHVRTRVHPMNF